MQYRSVIFYAGAQQQKLARESLKAEETRLGKMVNTFIEPSTSFYIAEDYHQKYYFRQYPNIANELYAIYPNPSDFRDSTAVARLNGYMGGYGDVNTLNRDLDKLGLSDSAKQALLRIAEFGLTPACPFVTPSK